MDKETYQLLDYDQYRLFVAEANKNGKAEWIVSYKFKPFYQVSSLEPQEYDKIFERMKTDKSYLEKIYKIHYADGPKGGMPTEASRIDYMLCRYSSGNLYAFDKCVNGSYASIDDFFRIAVVGKWLFPDWKIAVPKMGELAEQESEKGFDDEEDDDDGL